MTEPKTTPKKISRTDLANLSTWETMQLAREIYVKLFRYIKRYRWRFYLGMGFEVLAGMSSAIFVYGFKIIFDIVLVTDANAKNNEVKPIKIPFIHDKVDIMHFFPEWLRGTLTAVIFACVLVPTLFLMKGFLNYIASYLTNWVGNRVLYDMRNDAYRSVLSQSVGYFSQAKTGNLVQTVFNQSRVAQANLITLSQDIVQRPVAIASILGTLIYMNWQFTLYSLVIFPLCMVPVAMISKKVRKSGTEEEAEAGAMLVYMTEAFAGIRVVKSHAREDYELDRFNKSNANTKNLVMRYSKARELVGMLVETVASFGVGIGLFYAWKTKIEVTTFMTLVGGLTQIYPHAKALSQMQILLQKTLVASTSVFATMEQVPDVQDAPDALALPRVKGNVRLTNVNFTYKTSKKKQRPAVHDFNLDMEPGKYYALVGPSGAGKSTLFALLQRFYDVDDGSITVDGVDIRNATQKSLRDNFGVVSQDVFLFHDSILQNIRYGRLDARKEEIVEAAMKAHADEFIREQEFKYDTIIGEKGCRLSGGQQQRVSIARAILRNAPILLLDEATSALDTESEKIIQEALHSLSRGKTVIAIAHRLSTILEADKIVVMEKGRVLDIGPHAELLQRCELYQRLYQLQFKSGNVDPNEVIEDVTIEAAV